MGKLWAQARTATRPRAATPTAPAPEIPTPPAAPANPLLDFEQPDEAFEALRRVTKAADEKRSFVVFARERVPPHQRYLSRVDLKNLTDPDE
ncbi:MAG TPA: hypothetical protein VGH15_12190 [Caulobacteraceae bacterium]